VTVAPALIDETCFMDHDTQIPMPPGLEVEKAFPQRHYLCLYRLVKRATFTCHHCGLEKTSKLVAFAKDKWDQIMRNGCYGRQLSALERQGKAA
jgi:hypothetical protein